MIKLRSALTALALIAVGLFAAATPASASVHPNTPCKTYTVAAGNPVHWANGLGNGPGSGVYSWSTTPDMYAGPTGDACTGIAIANLQWPDGLAHHTNVGVAYDTGGGTYVWTGTWYVVISGATNYVTIDHGTPRGQGFEILVKFDGTPWQLPAGTQPTFATIHC